MSSRIYEAHVFHFDPEHDFDIELEFTSAAPAAIEQVARYVLQRDERAVAGSFVEVRNAGQFVISFDI